MRRRLSICALVWASFGGSAQQPRAEDQIRAALVLSFARFSQWPQSSAGNSFTICVIGHPGLAAHLEKTAEGKFIQGRPVEVKAIQPPQSPGVCHLLYVGETPKEPLRVLLAALRESASLTIGEPEGFLEWGGIVWLYRSDDRLRFEVSQAALDSSGIQISSRLLKLGLVHRNRAR
jgi:hypothetical protein